MPGQDLTGLGESDVTTHPVHKCGARALLDRCNGLSSSVLYDRVRELSSAGLIEKDGNGDYRLTALGRDLGAALQPLDAWAKRWAKRPDADAG